MSMPRNLVLVRHGESEGNIAKQLSEHGDHSLFTEEFLRRHSSTFHLTDKGIGQAEMAGEWMRKNMRIEFHRFYTSPYIRAIETAALLKIPFAKWASPPYLRERDWGDLDIASEQEKEGKYKKEMDAHKRDGFFWRVLNIETMSSVCARVDLMLRRISRECGRKNAVVVCHGEVMWAFRILLEEMTPWEYAELAASTDKKDMILNCQILHYTREDPTSPGTKKLLSSLDWMRSVCPTDQSLSRNLWTPIKRRKYSNEELLKIAERTPRMIK